MNIKVFLQPSRKIGMNFSTSHLMPLYPVAMIVIILLFISSHGMT